jgi:hypothetical protein
LNPNVPKFTPPLRVSVSATFSTRNCGCDVPMVIAPLSV